jgi:hypothetical protein
MGTIDIVATRLDPAEAELTITVVPDAPAADEELRGRLMGPRNLFAETVEIAYPIKPLPHKDDLPRARVIIPEPNFWTPETPFLYLGPLELWQAGQCADRRQIVHGLRQLVFTPKGFRSQGEPFKLHGVLRSVCSESDARQLRQAGCNLLLAPVAAASAPIWDLADRFGFLVLGQIDLHDQEALWLAEATLSRHPSCIGWVLPQEALQYPQHWHNAMALLHGQRRDLWVGLRVADEPLGVLPGHVSFLLCEDRLLAELTEISLPKIGLAKRGSGRRTIDPGLETAANVMGWIYRDMPGGATA